MKFTTTLLALSAPLLSLALTPKHDVNLELSALSAPQVGDTLELLLEAIHSIPDDVLLAGDETTQDWLIAHNYRNKEPPSPIVARAPEPVILSDSTALSERATAAPAGIIEVLNCAAKIAAFILENAIPAAKILKIKKAIDIIGSVKKVAEMLRKVRSLADAKRIGGQALFDIADAIIGFSSVWSACT
ncbi:hypothetical protein QBC34DRAFT_311705 [Podospora aff. communis PSN243]|uniref:Uncharacterized protein n=1 Tax=Podospora aff. communis PSN243 TaxID=3040156 RepID=A0AAV9G396_9PEZI|nr:hypothetical protein QBC34DRAFT_311705 [Podospora aff. communis PSN243]